MKQALHIFQKDIRYLRYDIAITLAAVVAFAVTAAYNLSLLAAFLPVTWWFLIARVIHAEPLPGHRQFWLTRPYRWQSLLGAKALFIAAFVNLPLLLADILIIHAAGASVGHQLGGLLWTQVLLTAAFILPAAAFAVITGGLTDLLLVTLLIVVGLLLWLVAGVFLHRTSSSTPWLELEWVKDYLVIAQLAGAALLIVLWQYARRHTAATRIVVGLTALLLLLSTSLFPWSAAFALQTHVSQNAVGANSVHVELDAGRSWLGRVYPAARNRTIAEIPLQITGLPADTELVPNGLKVTLRMPGGETLLSDQPPPESFSFESGITSLRAAMPTAFYSKIKNESLQLRGTLSFTLYGHRQSTTIPLTGTPVSVNTGLLCSAGNHFVRCSSLFRVPAGRITLRVYEDSSNRPAVSSQTPFSRNASPFPADLNVNPLSQSFFSPIIDPITGAQIETREPIAYLTKSFDIHNVHLDSFARNSSSKAIK